MEKFIHVDRCDSTQDLLKEQLTQHPYDDFTVSCEFQSQGRGRGENIWQDSAGTICFSMNISPHIEPSFTALEISVLVSRFFENKGSVIKLKWPNDLQDQKGNKCGGILIQNSGALFLAGIGINLFHEDQQLGSVFETSFSLEKKNWVKEISQFIRTNRYQLTNSLTHDWLSRCAHLNQNVRIIEGETESVGIFKGIGIYGEALLEKHNQIQHLFNGSLRLV